jgi:hypothetical protein
MRLSIPEMGKCKDMSAPLPGKKRPGNLGATKTGQVMAQWGKKRRGREK